MARKMAGKDLLRLFGLERDPNAPKGAAALIEKRSGRKKTIGE